MPGPSNLVGQRFGKLVVLSAHGRGKFGHVTTAWLCQCDCGRQEVYAQPMLISRGVQACRLCRQPACVVCGRTVPLDRGRKNTCSATCETHKNRSTWLNHYYGKIAADPEFNRRRHQRVLERLQSDPQAWVEYQEGQRAIRKQRWTETVSDPEKLQAQRLKMREWYARNAERVQQQRRTRLATMDAETHARWMDRVRELGKQYRRRWRAELKSNPEKHQKYLDLMREYRRQRALRSLAGVGDQLIDRMSNDN